MNVHLNANRLLVIDPGKHAGLAYFVDEELVDAQLVVDAVKIAWEGLSWGSGCHVVCEVPQAYPGSAVSTQSLLTLSITAGYLIAACRPASVRLVRPREWKGQRQKSVDHRRTRGLLSNKELELVSKLTISSAKLHNVLDAIGIGLWALERKVRP